MEPRILIAEKMRNRHFFSLTSPRSAVLSSSFSVVFRREYNVDECLLDVFLQLRSLHCCSVDMFIGTPEYSHVFLERSRQHLGDIPEHTLLSRLMYLRKNGKVPPLREEHSSPRGGKGQSGPNEGG